MARLFNGLGMASDWISSGGRIYPATVLIPRQRPQGYSLAAFSRHPSVFALASFTHPKRGAIPSTLGTPEIPLRLGGRKGIRIQGAKVSVSTVMRVAVIVPLIGAGKAGVFPSGIS